MKKSTTASFSVALIYIAFVTLIGVAVYITKSGFPLFALIFTPDIKINGDDGCNCSKE